MKILHHDQALIRVANVADATAAGIDASTVVAVLGSVAARQSVAVSAEVELAGQESLAMLPITRGGAKFNDVIPASIARLNGVRWGDDNVGLELLRMLGIAETDRRLFLSYRQAETSALARQLRSELSERRYDVFLDRFSVPPGADFQRRIDIELSDKAFVLLLESRGAIGSDWVQHEVAFALSHRIAVLALTMPGTNTSDQCEVVDDAYRHLLDDDSFNGAFGSEAVLSDQALQRVLGLVELRYAQQVRRRRVQLLGTTTDYFSQAGYDPIPADDWAVVASKDGVSQVALITATPPLPRDLRRVDQLRRSLIADVGEDRVQNAWVVYDAPMRDYETTELLDWIATGRPVRVVRLTEFAEMIA